MPRSGWTSITRPPGQPRGPAFGVGFASPAGGRVLSCDTDIPGERYTISGKGSGRVTMVIPVLQLQPGNYFLDVGCRSGDNVALDYLPSFGQVEVLPGPGTPSVIIGRRETGSVRPSGRDPPRIRAERAGAPPSRSWRRRHEILLLAGTPPRALHGSSMSTPRAGGPASWKGSRSLPDSGTRCGCCMDWLDRSSPRSVWRSAQLAASRPATSAWPWRRTARASCMPSTLTPRPSGMIATRSRPTR